MFVRFPVSDCNQHQKCNHNTNWNKNRKGKQKFVFIYSLQKEKKVTAGENRKKTSTESNTLFAHKAWTTGREGN